MAEKTLDISGRFSDEINDIKYILQNLENGLVTELHPQAKMYGSLAHNVDKLRTKLNEVLYKLEYDKPSDSEVLGEVFFNDKEKLK